MNRIVLIFLATISVQLVQAQDSLQLQQVLAIARTEVPEVEQARLLLEERKWNFKAYRAGLLPQLRLEGTLPNYQRSFSPVVQPDGGLQFQPVVNQNSNLGVELSQLVGLTGGTVFVSSQLQRFDDFENDFTQYSSMPVTFGYRQTIFGFNAQRWDGKIEPLRATFAERRYLNMRENSALTAANLYFDLLLAQLDTQMARQNAQYGAKMLEIAKLRHELGRLSENDLLQLEYNLLNARQSSVNARQLQEAARRSLRTFLNLPADSLHLSFPAAPPSYTLAAEEAVKAGRRYRETLLDFEIRLLEAESRRQQVKRESGFTADLYASVGLADRSDNLQEVYQGPVNQQVVSLGISVPLVDWGRGRAATQAAETALKRTQSAIAQEELRFEEDIRLEVSRFQLRQQEMEVARKAAELAERRYAISRESFALGRQSITELSLAQLEKDAAKRAYVQNLREAWLAHLRLRVYTLYDFNQHSPIRNDQIALP